MGCGCTSAKQVKYKHGLETRSISEKDLKIIKKWAGGAIGRRKFKKLIQTKMIA